MRKNMDQKNSEYGDFLRSVSCYFFIKKTKASLKFALNRYGVNEYGSLDCIEIYNGIVLYRTSLSSLTEKADGRVVQHIPASTEDGMKKLLYFLTI